MSKRNRAFLAKKLVFCEKSPPHQGNFKKSQKFLIFLKIFVDSAISFCVLWDQLEEGGEKGVAYLSTPYKYCFYLIVCASLR
jgi:hypothetical protein